MNEYGNTSYTKISRCLFVAVFVGIVVYVALAFVFGNIQIHDEVNSKEMVSIDHVEKTIIDNGNVKYGFSVSPQATDGNSILQFMSGHQEVFVYIDDECVYSVEAKNSLFGKTVGNIMNIVRLPATNKTLQVKVVLKSIYSNVETNDTLFYYSDAASFVKETVKDSILPAGISWIVVIIGLVIIGYWMIFQHKFEKSTIMLNFGIFTFLLGLWSLIETDLFVLLMDNRKVASVMGYCLLMLMVVPFVNFVSKIFEANSNKWAARIGIISCIIDVVLLVLHISGIVELKQSAFVVHGLVIAGLLYMVIVMIKHYEAYGFDHVIKMNVVASLILASSAIVDLFAYYQGARHTDIFGKIGILFYIIILAKQSIDKAIRKLEEAKKAQFYKEMAITDTMTGLYNRSAFEDWEERVREYTDVCLVTFDLNNLKYCNDNFGHKAGDEYIENAAAIIRDVFGIVGKCYRIGGDEFIAIIERASRVDVEKLIKNLRVEEKNYNEGKDGMKMNIACGYAVYGDEDKDIEDTRNRADESMYLDKKKIKDATDTHFQR